MGGKALSWNPGEGILCPTTTAPYLCTNTNNCGAAKLSLGAGSSAQTGSTDASSSSSAVFVAVGSVVGVVALVAIIALVLRGRKYTGYQAL